MCHPDHAVRVAHAAAGQAGVLHYIRMTTAVFHEMEDYFHKKEHGWILRDRENHEQTMWEVFREMKEQMIGKMIKQNAIVYCEECGDKCKADNKSCISPLSQDYDKMLEYHMCDYTAAHRIDVWQCNHYLCRVCIANLHGQQNEEYACWRCEQDITNFIKYITYNRGFMSVEGDDEYRREVAQDIDSGAETEDERDD